GAIPGAAACPCKGGCPGTSIGPCIGPRGVCNPPCTGASVGPCACPGPCGPPWTGCLANIWGGCPF
ncbi:Mst84Dd, putative, partial [Ixodes scapularis]